MSLRLLQVVLPIASADDLESLLTDVPPDLVWRDDIAGGLRFVSILLRADQVEPLSDAINERFRSEVGFRLILFPIEATKPKLPEPTKPEGDGDAPGDGRVDSEQPKNGSVSDAPKPLIGRISREELYEDIAAGVSGGRLFVVMVVLSTVVAAAGLLRDSAAVIIGAMVIAPLLGPNMALALGTTLGDRTLIRRSLAANGIGGSIALAMSVVVGLLVPIDADGAELVARTTVGATDIVLALASGTAGALAFTTGAPATLVGVMVAVALLPPTTAAGLYFGMGDAERGLSAASLVAVNVVCVNLAATATFLAQGVRPDTWWAADRARGATRRAILAWIGLLGLLGALLSMRSM
jgi:uncharacterized hydrophobic protein (TIGR00341 family)